MDLLNKFFIVVLVIMLLGIVALIIVGPDESKHKLNQDRVAEDISRYENDEVICYSTLNGLQCKFK